MYRRSQDVSPSHHQQPDDLLRVPGLRGRAGGGTVLAGQAALCGVLAEAGAVGLELTEARCGAGRESPRRGQRS
jgi:hypothetical protein